MVINYGLTIILFALLSLFNTSAFAETQLNASVDRSKIYEMDTLNLTIQGQVDVDFSFGGLMNFGLGQNEAPAIEGLEKDFEILDTKQSYNMQSINGNSKAQVVWRYTLAPKNVGVLEIPPAKYKDAQTKPILITVMEGKAPKNASEPPAIFLEVETDKDTAYVQEQIIYTLRLYTQGLINGELSEPTSKDAIIEPFGEQKKYYRMAFNQRYEVVERQYLIFPQKSGSLTIDKQTFQGISLKHGNRTRLKDLSDSIELTIKPPAKSFTGKNWLPATSLFLNEAWQGDIDGLKVGDSITRKIELSVLGLLGSALPPITMKDHQLYKLYTDKPLTESVKHEAGSQAKRTDSFAIVAIKEGSIELDEIRIPWWDTVNDVERVAIIPARTLSIAVNPQLPSQTATPIAQSKNKSLATNQDKPNNQALNLSPRETTQLQNQTLTKQENDNHLWQTISGALLLLWIITCAYGMKQLSILKAKLKAIPLPKQVQDSNEKDSFNKALNAIKSSDTRLTQDVLHWLNNYTPTLNANHQLTSLQDIKDMAPSIYQHLDSYEKNAYSKNSSDTFNKEKLITCIKDYRTKNLAGLNETKQADNKPSLFKAKSLEPFYR